MENGSFRVNAAGCSLVDNLYGRTSFETAAYRRLVSRSAGDGGLVTGGLTFSDALTAFAGSRPEDYPELLAELAGGRAPDSSNIGGPGIVPVIHASQVRRNPAVRYRFSGVIGRDENGRRLESLLAGAGFSSDDYRKSDMPTPSTDVLSDPAFGGGRGERTFINTIGAAAAFGPESLPTDFFDAELLLFGATALVPPLHDALDGLCRRGRAAGAFVMVCTVFDFRSEARMRGRPWPLVDDYGSIDLLVMDREESLKISGCTSPAEAVAWFLTKGCGAVVVTQGVEDVLLAARDGGPFSAPRRTAMPTCRYADEVAAGLDTPHDTTGCGDNFVGGLLDSIAHQMAGRNGTGPNVGNRADVEDGRVAGSEPDVGRGPTAADRGLAPGGPDVDRAPAAAGEPASGEAGRLNLEEAVVSGMAAGAFALTCLGGVYYEDGPGDKLALLAPYVEAYRNQLSEGAP